MNHTNRRRFLVFAPMAAAALAMPVSLRAQSSTSIADTLAGDNRFRRFLDIVTHASAVEEFRQQGPITLFAPTDAAFVNAPAGLLQDLRTNSNDSGSGGDASDRSRWLALITYHIVPGAFTLAQLGGEDRRLRTRNGGDIRLSGTGSDIRITNPAPARQLASFGAFGAQAAPPAQIVGSEIRANNGVIVPIDQILWP
jgi:uncharacterized surface protein with fasciclin (FAS1) repeats